VIQLIDFKSCGRSRGKIKKKKENGRKVDQQNYPIKFLLIMKKDNNNELSRNLIP
jgi:hypothetical protein